MFKRGTLVRFCKLQAVENAEYSTPSKEDYIPGEVNRRTSVPIDYEVKGQLFEDIEPGGQVSILRWERNGVPITGIMQTSHIQRIETFEDHLIIRTRNSVYVLEEIKEENS